MSESKPFGPSAAGWDAARGLASTGWRVRDPNRILRNASLQAKEDCPAGSWYASRAEALTELREWYAKWAHQLYFPQLDEFSRVAVEKGWWVCTKIEIAEIADYPDASLLVPCAKLHAEARSESPGYARQATFPAPSSRQQHIQDVVWLTIEPSAP